MEIQTFSESYDSKLFIQPPNEVLECPICVNIMKDPVQCPTQGHTFCRHCVSKHLERTETCPVCRQPLQKDKLIPNRLICSLIKDTEVRCYSYIPTDKNRVKTRNQRRPNVLSCDWSGKLKDRETHYKQCPFAHVNCPNDDCDEVLSRKVLPQHMVDCIHGLIRCDWCNLSGKMEMIDAHSKVCLNRPAPCPNDCVDGNGIPLLLAPSAIAHHLTVCPMELVGCAYAEAGCKIQLKRKDMPVHEKNAEAHMVCFLEALQESRSESSDLKRVVAEQNITMAEQNITIEKLNSSFSWRVPVSNLQKTEISATVTIKGYHFKFHLQPNIIDIGWHSINLCLLEDNKEFVLCDLRGYFELISDSMPSQTYKRKFFYKFLKPKGCGGISKYIKTEDLQRPTFVTDGHVTFRAELTVQTP